MSFALRPDPAGLAFIKVLKRVVLSPASPSLAVLLLTGAGTGQERQIARAKTPFGQVEIHYQSATLRGRGLADLEAGKVWRMSAGAAAELVTEVPLISDRVILAPGRYRLSARYLGKDRFRLLVFRGPRLHEEGTPCDELPLALGTEKNVRETLTFRLWHSEDDNLRTKLHWGTQSLNFSLQPIRATNYRLLAAGKPATLTIFELPKAKVFQDQLKAGTRLLFGRLLQDGAAGIEYLAYGVNHRRRGFQVLFRNVTLDDTRLCLEAERGRLARLAATLANAAAERQQPLQQAIRQQARQIEALTARLEVAERHARKVEVACPLKMGQVTEALAPSPTSKPTPSGDGKTEPHLPSQLDIELTFGARTASLRIDGQKFADSE